MHLRARLGLFLLFSGCAAAGDPDSHGGSTELAGSEPLDIYVYAADDPRPASGGFVSAAKRATTVVDGVEFTLMAWAIEDTLTLGAMVKSDAPYEACFRMPESVTYSVGPDAHGQVPAVEDPTRVAEGAGFRGFHWVTFELDRAMLPEGSTLALGFTPRDAAADGTPPTARLPGVEPRIADSGTPATAAYVVHYAPAPVER